MEKKFNKEFEIIDSNSSNPEIESIQECIKIYKKIYEWIEKNLSEKFKSIFYEKITCEILNISLKIEEYDFELFENYLKSQMPKFSQVLPAYKELMQKKKKSVAVEYDNSFWNNKLFINNSKWIDFNTLAENFLKKYFENSESIAPYDKYFNLYYFK